MNSTTEHNAILRNETKDRRRAGRRPGIMRLGVKLALTVATVAFAQNYRVLKHFAFSDGRGPRGCLVLGGNTLYGTTEEGGSYSSPNRLGVVYKVNTDGSGFAVLKRLNVSDGYGPEAGLVLSVTTLYGTTAYGGSGAFDPARLIWGYGTVFKVNTDGSGFAVLRSFTGGSDGGNPFGGMVLSGNTLYGTTGNGGLWGNGVVFSGVCRLTLTRQPLTQTAEAGSTVVFRAEAESFGPGLAYQWFFDGTNGLLSATNAFLELTNVQFAQAGAYTATVTNVAAEVATSTPALLSVIPPVDRRVVPALHLPGGTGTLLHLEYADSLAAPQWLSLLDVVLSSGPQFCFDLSQPLAAQRFYRAWGTNGPQPVLDASMATEIPLAGAVGEKLRVDYINQLGPIDAWVTLDAVTLTNTTQLYYDLTMFHQPTRLYRVVPVP